MPQYVVIQPLKYSFVNSETGMIVIERYATKYYSPGNLWCSLLVYGMNFQQYWFDQFCGVVGEIFSHKGSDPWLHTDEKVL